MPETLLDINTDQNEDLDQTDPLDNGLHKSHNGDIDLTNQIDNYRATGGGERRNVPDRSDLDRSDLFDPSNSEECLDERLIDLLGHLESSKHVEKK